jgi:lysophospholipid acyltransferase (LPLAT)-like uncharacterized protein
MNEDHAKDQGAVIRILGRILAAGFIWLSASWRITGTDSVRSEYDRLKGRPLLIVFWHGKYLPLFAALRGIPARIFVGAGFRGQLISVICENFGFRPVLLPHHRRSQAIDRMRAALEGSMPCASAFDGALGSARRAKPTLVRLASESGATVLPISVSAHPRLVLGWRWDRREIPLPFAYIQLRVGQPIRIPSGLCDTEIDQWCARLEIAVDRLDLPTIERKAVPSRWDIRSQ